MAGLDLASAQDAILSHIQTAAPDGYDVYEGDIPDAAERAMENGVAQPTWVVQFGDLLPSANEKSFCGPEQDGYYSLVRIFSIGSNPSACRKANSIANQVMIGYSASNVGAISKEGGGGAYALGESNTRPLAYGLISSYKYATNLTDVGSTVWPETS